MATPTQAELEILQALWLRGEASVKAVNEDLNNIRPIGYTTTLKSMQLMTQKGWLGRRLDGKSHIYYSKLKEEETKGNLLRRFVDSTFQGSRSSLLIQLLGQESASAEELDEIKSYLKKLEGNNND